MKENKSQDNKEPKGPYKHFQRPTTSRSAMHHRHAELEPESKQAPKTPNESDQNSHGMHHSQLWAGLIIVSNNFDCLNSNCFITLAFKL